MENLFINATIISVIFFLIKFAEMRIILKESRPLKELVKDTLIVYFSIITGIFIFEQVSPAEITTKSTRVFTDPPGF
jgi:hypothetical protein